MNALDKLLRDAKKVYLLQSDKAIFISDLHMGIKDEADDFQRNELIAIDLLERAYDNGYFLFILGDYLELFENSDVTEIMLNYPLVWGLIEKFKEEGRLYRVRGNHDILPEYPEAYHVIHANGSFLVAHGHQNDFMNSGWRWYISKWFVRHIWRGLQYLGLHDPTMANAKRHEKVELKLDHWCNKRAINALFGHTHVQCHRGYYRNCGSWVGKGGQGITFMDGKFELMIWG